jgi:hypothetical protein
VNYELDQSGRSAAPKRSSSSTLLQSDFFEEFFEEGLPLPFGKSASCGAAHRWTRHRLAWKTGKMAIDSAQIIGRRTNRIALSLAMMSRAASRTAAEITRLQYEV